MDNLAESHLIYKVRAGSHAYGTSTPLSDEDFAGIFIPPIDYFFGLQAFDLQNEQNETDNAYYSLRKYANLAVASNPNVLELLFVDPSDHLLVKKEMYPLLQHRDLFLSRRARKTYIGYAFSQLTRIRNHRKWLSQEMEIMSILRKYVTSGFLSAEWLNNRFGTNMMERINKDAFLKERTFTVNVDSSLNVLLESNLLPLLKPFGIVCPDPADPQFYHTNGNRTTYYEHEYKEAKKKRDQYVTWMAERNEKRHMDEIEHGYDCKHAAHLVRLLRTGHEILTSGILQVKRHDAQELTDIRAGKWTYEELTSYADEMVAAIDALPDNKIVVPETPDVKAINKLVIDITCTSLGVDYASR